MDKGDAVFRSLVILILGALLGAAAFHAWYLGLKPERRCFWDHPLNPVARAACATTSRDVPVYGARARHELDDLVGKLSR